MIGVTEFRGRSVGQYPLIIRQLVEGGRVEIELIGANPVIISGGKVRQIDYPKRIVPVGVLPPVVSCAKEVRIDALGSVAAHSNVNRLAVLDADNPRCTVEQKTIAARAPCQAVTAARLAPRPVPVPARTDIPALTANLDRHSA